jgi:CheY-like chemotaxis protein
MQFGTEHPVILVVDDDQHVLDEVHEVLAHAELASCCCTTANEAILATQTTIPDLILCDANLQGKSGVELCERIKQQPGMKDIPVMLLSSSQSPDLIRRRCAAGSSYCLRKPFDQTVLLELIDQAIGVSET